MHRPERSYWLGAAGLAAAVLMWTGARFALPLLSAAAAAAFVIVVLVLGAAANRAAPGASPSGLVDAPVLRARRNAMLMGAVYGFGAAVILAVYTSTGLRWYHFWQYGGAMALIAAGLFWYSGRLAAGAMAGPGALRTATLLTAVQGAAALAGLVFLVGSGKLVGTRPDWLANQVFLSGGLAIVALSAMAVISQLRSAR
jgi:hypothetical protein